MSPTGANIRRCWPRTRPKPALRGFAEVETTVRVARHAPFNALCILVGTQTGRGGVLTQCAVEEALGLKLAMKGLTTYAETLSVYGTERAFIDGDDTPWSKAFLSSAYASRGVKIRFTSGTGSEALMGHAEQQLDALSGGALPADRARRRQSGRAKRLDLVYRTAGITAGRRAGGAGRKPDGCHARPGMCIRE